MKRTTITFALGALALAGSLWAQTAELPPAPPIEKELAARASNVTEVTLGKNMLAFAAKFMNGKDADEANTRKLIEGLDGIYVREYEFDKEGQVTPDEIEQLRKYFETGDWSPMVRERDRKQGETTDVMIKLVNGESHGLFVLDAGPKELTIVLILGPIRADQIGELKGVAGLSVLGDVAKDAQHKENKDKGRKGGSE